MKTISFETNRELTDGDVICLDYAPIRGIISWSKVSYEELPISVHTQSLLLHNKVFLTRRLSRICRVSRRASVGFSLLRSSEYFPTEI